MNRAERPRISKRKAQAIMVRSQRDPCWWAESVLGVKLTRLQRHALIAMVGKRRRISIKTCNGVGKSFVAAVIVLWFCSVFADSFAITTATKFTQVRAIVWREIQRLVARARVPLGVDLLATEARWPNGSVALGMTAPADDTTKFIGFRGKRTLIIVDEAPGVSSAIIEGVYSMLTGAEVRLLMIGNPTDPVSEFARSFKSDAVEKLSMSAFESPNVEPFGVMLEDIESGEWEKKQPVDLPFPELVTSQWIRERWEEWTDHGTRYTDPRWQARVLGNFPTEGEDTTIPMPWLEACCTLYDPDFREGPAELGVDVADRGTDATSIAVRWGAHARIARRLTGQDLMVSTGAVVMVYDDTEARIAKVDTIGVGAGVAARLRELGKEIDEVMVSERADDPEKYKNRRAELAWNLRLRAYESYRAVSEGREPEGPYMALERDDHLLTDMNSVRWKQNSTGQIELEAKDETKKRLGRSPDDGDAIMLCFAPVRRQEPVKVTAAERIRRKSYFVGS